MTELTTKSFKRQALAFPKRVDEALAEIETIEQAKDIPTANATASFLQRI